MSAAPEVPSAQTMVNAVQIRRLTAADAGDYRAIRLAALEHDPHAFGSSYADEASRPMSHFVQRVTSCVVLGAYAEGRIVGMAGFKQEAGHKDRHKAFVWGFYVDRRWRRKGVGSALIGALIEMTCNMVEQLKLTVVAGNEAAIALYENAGFAIYGVEPRALKDEAVYQDEVLMVRFMR
jgi:ribosomal protein S18 acetylase RimI-like enzyme